MVSIDILEKRGITHDNLEKWLTGDPLANDPGAMTRFGADGRAGEFKINESDTDEIKDIKARRSSLMRRLRSRVQEAMARNLASWRLYYALDLAWDVSFSQTSPTLLSTLMDKDCNDAKVREMFKEFGAFDCLREIQDPDNPTKKKYEMNFPLFVSTVVPLVQAYVKIRWAKIMNDRRLTPFFEYVPAKMTASNMAKCAAITDRVQVISNQYGYYDVQKQAVLKMLHYGTALQFIKESWHWEDQLKYATQEDVDEANGTGTNPPEGVDEESTEGGPAPAAEGSPSPAIPNENVNENQEFRDANANPEPNSTPAPSPRKKLAVGDIIEATEREGLRYHLPHPSRSFYDMAYGPYTLNYDYGCEFSGYWRIERYRTLQASSFWNKDKIALGTDLISANPLFFQSVYSACTMTVPAYIAPPAKQPDGPVNYAEFGSGAGRNDRETQLATLYYGNEHGDMGVLVTEYFEKLVPKQWGLGDYDYPVWFRFTVAGDGCTVLYCEPVPYGPTTYYGYDCDESRTKNPSMSLEVLPFQDQFSNMLTQILLTAKQNLANMVFVDEAQVEAGWIERLRNTGEKMFRQLNIFKYDSKKAAKYQAKISEAVQSFKFPQGNTSELTAVLKTLLDVLERILVMSSNEVGQAASHEQTREEIRNIQASTSSRLVFTTTPVDIAAEAWKRQLYIGLMNYGDEHMYIHIPSDVPLTKDTLEKMGFIYMDADIESRENGHRSHKRYRVPKKIVAVSLWEFASAKDQADRINNDKIAMALATLFDKIMTNPMTAEAVGAQQALEWANEISHFAGLPDDFKLRDTSPATTPEDQQAQAQGQLKQVVGAVLGKVNDGLKQELDPLLNEVKKNSTDIALLMQTVSKIAGHPNNDTNGEPQPAGR